MNDIRHIDPKIDPVSLLMVGGNGPISPLLHKKCLNFLSILGLIYNVRNSPISAPKIVERVSWYYF